MNWDKYTYIKNTNDKSNAISIYFVFIDIETNVFYSF